MNEYVNYLLPALLEFGPPVLDCYKNQSHGLDMASYQQIQTQPGFKSLL